jgi:A/G-specific adenine glycosylase
VKLNGKIPSTREELENLDGISQYIASAILSICYHKKEPLLDVNMSRLLERFFGQRNLVDIRYDPYLQKLSRMILPNRNIKEFNWAIIDYAAIVCKIKQPECLKCIFSKRCNFHSDNK